MMINRRRVCGGKKGLLPSGYAQLEYIENTSYAYIDSGVQAGTISFALEIDYYISVIPHSFAAFIGNESNTTNVPWVGFEKSGQGCSITMGGGWARLFFSFTRDTGRHNFTFTNDYSKANLVFDGTDKGTVNSYPYVDLGFNLYLFANNQRGIPIQQLSAKFYSVKIWNNYTLVRNFIPCINPNNVVGMYDTVEGKFYSSPNGTAFVAGPVTRG